MAKFSKRDIASSIEHNILTASILSTRFLEEIYPLYDANYFKNKFARKVFSWIWNYFDTFGEAPKHSIKNIFELESTKLDESEEELIGAFLKKLSTDYVENQGINEEYVLQQCLDYFNKRETEIRVEFANKYIEIGNIEKAQEELAKVKKVIRMTSNWENPMDSSTIHKTLADQVQHELFKLPGALGKFIGPLERGWFVAILAPFKRGKTWLMFEFAIIAALSGLKVSIISLEMKAKDVNNRIYKRLTAFVENDEVSVTIPVFDCAKNQAGTCTNPNRKNNIPLEIDGEIPEYSKDLDYRICDKCRNTKEFVVTTWFETIPKEQYNHINVSKHLKKMAKYFGNNFRVKCYPRFTASMSDIEKDLELLEYTEGFVSDVIITDYADIIRPDSKSRDGRSDIDEIWKRHASLSGTKRALVVSASQGTRGSLHKENMNSEDLAEWIGKLGHVDKFICINQSLSEKRKGIVRVAKLADRHMDFNEEDQVVVLQSLDIGQVHLDSYQPNRR